MIHLNPIRYRQKVLSQPLKKSSPKLLELMADPNPRVSLPALALLMYAAAPVFAGNIVTPAALINMGKKGQKYHTGISYGLNSIGFPMPLFHYATPASKAARLGAKVGGKLGARIGARLIPGIGYGLLAYDVYDVVVNRSLWGFDFD